MTPVIPGWMAFAWRTLVLGAKKFVAIDGTQRGAAFAYYAIFSLFPLLVLFVSVGSAFVDREVAVKSVLEYVERFVPLEPEMQRKVLETISGIIQSRKQVSSIALVILVWGSLQFFTALVRATNRAWNIKMHNWWQMPLKNLSLIGVLGTTLLVGIVAPIGARLVLSLFPRTFSLAELAERMALVIIPILVVVLGLALFY